MATSDEQPPRASQVKGTFDARRRAIMSALRRTRVALTRGQRRAVEAACGAQYDETVRGNRAQVIPDQPEGPEVDVEPRYLVVTPQARARAIQSALGNTHGRQFVVRMTAGQRRAVNARRAEAGLPLLTKEDTDGMAERGPSE